MLLSPGVNFNACRLRSHSCTTCPFTVNRAGSLLMFVEASSILSPHHFILLLLCLPSSHLTRLLRSTGRPAAHVVRAFPRQDQQLSLPRGMMHPGTNNLYSRED